MKLSAYGVGDLVRAGTVGFTVGIAPEYSVRDSSDCWLCHNRSPVFRSLLFVLPIPKIRAAARSSLPASGGSGSHFFSLSCQFATTVIDGSADRSMWGRLATCGGLLTRPLKRDYQSRAG